MKNPFTTDCTHLDHVAHFWCPGLRWKYAIAQKMNPNQPSTNFIQFVSGDIF